MWVMPINYYFFQDVKRKFPFSNWPGLFKTHLIKIVPCYRAGKTCKSQMCIAMIRKLGRSPYVLQLIKGSVAQTVLTKCLQCLVANAFFGPPDGLVHCKHTQRVENVWCACARPQPHQTHSTLTHEEHCTSGFVHSIWKQKRLSKSLFLASFSCSFSHWK